jgi:anaerobic ribonucleoside-triphosphate reductase activating protein
MKYYNAMVVFEEIPNEVTLAINITNCPCHCKGCHSKFLWEDVGTELSIEELDALLEKHNGITCVCFMGGDAEPEIISALAEYVHEIKELKVGWYSGMDELSDKINLDWFNYIKIGHYDENLGALNKETTNQRLYIVEHNKIPQGEVYNINYKLEDITHLFWKKSGFR